MISFFFIPASKTHKYQAVKSLGVDNVIVDFEDSVLIDDRGLYFDKIREIADYRMLWYRVPIRESFTEDISLDFLKQFLSAEINKIIIPKLISSKELNVIKQSIGKNVQLILLVEHPRMLIELKEILQDENLSANIYGIGFGSHDMMSFMGAKHSLPQILYPRLQILYTAKAYNKVVIDIASMNIENEEDFKEELAFGRSYGFDGKFLIHPIQFDWMHRDRDFVNERIAWARSILDALPRKTKVKDIEPFILNGQIIEKPHVEQAMLILKDFKDEE